MISAFTVKCKRCKMTTPSIVLSSERSEGSAFCCNGFLSEAGVNAERLGDFSELLISCPQKHRRIDQNRSDQVCVVRPIARPYKRRASIKVRISSIVPLATWGSSPEGQVSERSFKIPGPLRNDGRDGPHLPQVSTALQLLIANRR